MARPELRAALVDGRPRHAGDGRTIEVRNPADGSTVGVVPALSERDAREAVDAAQAAFGAWSTCLPQERSALLRRWFEAITERADELARLITSEQGKPLREARAEIDYGASFVEYYAEEARRPNIESVTSHLRGAEVEVWREPIGVAALVTPWNFPSAMFTRKAAAALAAGCTVVAHPSHLAPLSALALAELAVGAGIPAGVLNVVTGEAPRIVSRWTADPRVRALSFTGSTEIGRLLYRDSAATVKRLVLELGGHAPFVVFADAHLDHAVECAVAAKFATSGQDCLGANRFFVQEPIYETFCSRFAERTKQLRVGPGMEDPDIGPLIDEAAVRKQESHVEDALARDARLLAGGRRHPAGPLFFAPTLLADVPDDALVFREETFGPVAAVASFRDEGEVTDRANDTEHGLVAYLHTRDPGRIYRMSRALQYGMVAVNRARVTGAPIPFGGMKQSGLGREGARLGMEEFMEVKYVCRNWDA